MFGVLDFERLDPSFLCEARFRHFLSVLLSGRLDESTERLSLVGQCRKGLCCSEHHTPYYAGFLEFLEDSREARIKWLDIRKAE